MATQVQNRRGTTAEHSTFTGAVGELTVDTTKDTVVVHDGAVAGGRPLLREDQSNLPTSAPTTGIYNASGSLAISTNSVGRIHIGSTGTVNIVGAGTAGVTQAVSFNGSAPVNSMVLDSSGRLGVGTSSPSYALDVASADTTAGIGYALRLRQNATAGAAAIQFTDNPVTAQYGYIACDSSSNLKFATGLSERARIDSSGRLIVGTSSNRTGAALQVEGTTFGTSLGTITNNSANSAPAYFQLIKSRGTSVGSQALVSNGDGLGNVQFVGTDGTQQLVAAAIEGIVDGTPGVNDMPGRLVFSTTADGASSPTERMRIGSAGDVFYGQTAQTFPGVANTQTGSCLSDSGSVLSISRASATILNGNRNSDGAIVGFARSGTTVGTISVTTTATAYNTSSDYRLKENVTAVTDGITRLQQLKPSRFNFIADPTKTVDGFIAHEVQTVVPEAISGEKDAVDADGKPIYQGIDQSKLVPLLTAALQEAVAKIERLEARLTAADI